MKIPPESTPPPPAADLAPSAPEPVRRGPLHGEPTRLRPAAVAVWTLERLLALFFVIVTGGAIPAVGFAILGTIIGANVVRHLRFRWYLEEDALVIERGLLRRHRRVISRERIQAVDMERSLRHRTFGVVEVRVEALGGGATEGRLAALDPATAEELRRVLLGGAVSDPPVSEGEHLARVGPGNLVLAGLTGGRVGVGAAIVGFVLRFAPEDQLGRLFLMTNEELPAFLTGWGPGPFLLLAAIALLVSFIVSLLATVIRHWGFTLSRMGTTLRVQRGLLTEHRDTVPFGRIQAVRVEENLVRRWLGLATVKVVVAGRSGAQAGEGTDFILPIGSQLQAFRLAGEVAGLPPESIRGLSPMPSAARKRRLLRAGIATGATAGTAGIVGWLGEATPLIEPLPWSPVGLAAAALLVVAGPSLLLALQAYRGLGWADRTGHIVVREGALTRRTTIVPVNRLQAVETSASPFQRRRGLATLLLPIARPTGAGGPPRAMDLPDHEASALLERLVRRTSGPPPTPPLS